MKKAIVLFFILALGAWGTQTTYACGGLFCQNSPVDQNAERIIFEQNDDGTITSLIQIQYTGFAEDFSWILPIPEAIDESAFAVPEGAMDAFTELEIATNPVFIPPIMPECARIEVMAMMSDEAVEEGEAVEVFAEGEVGPFGFVVIGSEDPDALIDWLRENNYRVTAPMEPLIDVYVEEGFVFVAMQLLPGEGAQDIEPIQITYPSDSPMIPLRLTAVAANPDMAVLTWVFANEQAVPDNYAHMEIADEELVFSTFGGHNYRQLMRERADAFNGQAFITEFAGPTTELSFNNPLLQSMAEKHRYLTRLNTVISPEEMTVDPVFVYDADRPNVFNVHDLSNMTGLYDCERAEGATISIIDGNGNTTPINTQQEAIADPTDVIENVTQNTEETPSSFGNGVLVGVGAILLILLIFGGGYWIGQRGNS